MKVLFVASGNSNKGLSPLVRNQGESIKGNTIELDYFLIQQKGFYGYYKHIILLKQHLANKKYDLIHAHYGLSGVISQLSRKNEKLVVSFMGDDLIGQVGENGTYSLFGNYFVLINKIFLKYYDYIIVKSVNLAQKINKNKLEVIPNGVDLKAFYEIEKTTAKRKVNIEQQKRLIIFVSDPSRPEKNFKLAFNAINHVNCDNIIIKIIHSISQEELNYYYNACDLLLLTSIHEGSPNVIKEAMACNCPIVSTNVGDVKWVLGNTYGCYLTTYDLSDVAEKIKLALEYSKKVGRTEGRQRIIKLGLDSNTISSRIIKVYQSLLNS